MAIFDVNLEILPFDDIMTYAKDSGYAPLNLCNYNNASLELINGVAMVLIRDNTRGWVIFKVFNIESWVGGHWSDIDIDRAINDDHALKSLESLSYV